MRRFTPLNQRGNDQNFQQAMPFDPNLGNQNAHLSNLHGSNFSNFHGNNPNFQPMAQNNQLGILPQLGQLMALQLQNTPQFQGQMNLLAQMQNPNLAASLQQGGGLLWGHNAIQNRNQMLGVPNGQVCPQNQMLQGNQMMGLMGSSLNSLFMGNNPPLVPNNLNLSFGSGAMFPIETMQGNKQDHSTIGQIVSNGSSNAPPQPQPSPSLRNSHWNRKHMQQSSGVQQTQVFQVNQVEVRKDNGPSAISGSKISTRNFHGFGKGEPSHERFKKPQLHDIRHTKGNMRPFKRKGERGQQNWRERKFQTTNTGAEASAVHRRPLLVKYTKNEIQQWREARKKNFPTRDTISKKVASGSRKIDAGSDATLRRQQLKEVLAKQAELGVEVAEIPPSYLCEPEDRVHEAKNKSRVTDMDGQSSNKFKKKRGRYDRKSQHGKRLKFQNDVANASAPIVKCGPSLLEKLLSDDIKRDRSRLLQVFRFLVLNDFFRQWPDKPLEFPVVTVKDGAWDCDAREGNLPSLDCMNAADIGVKTVNVEGISGQKASNATNEDEHGSSEEDSDGGDDGGLAKNQIQKENGAPKQFAQSEEGEITE